eukprot:5872156-Prymnesium_polylepis.1
MTARRVPEPPQLSSPQRGRRPAHTRPDAATQPHSASRPQASRSSTRGSAASCSPCWRIDARRRNHRGAAPPSA